MYQLKRRNYLSPKGQQFSKVEAYSLDKLHLSNQNYHFKHPTIRKQPPINQQPFHRNYLIKSKISDASNSDELFSDELLFLLSNQQTNLEYFKEKIVKEKQRVQRDFNNFQTEIINLVEDLKTSLYAQLDNVYRDFIELYSSMKTQVNNFRKIRRNIVQSNQFNNQSKVNISNNISNRNIIQQISRDAQIFKHHQINNHLTELQLQQLTPILQLTKKIIILGAADKNYYQEHNTIDYLHNVKINIQRQLRQGFEIIHSLISNSQQVIKEEQKIQKENNLILKNSTILTSSHHSKQYIQSNPYGINHIKEQNQPHNVFRPLSNKEQINYHFLHSNNHMKKQKGSIHSNEERHRPYSQMKVYHNQTSKIEVSKDQQTIITEWLEEVQLEDDKTIIANQHTDIILCGLFVKNYFASGSKDTNIHLYDINSGKLCLKLVGHTASICCMANLGELLASGGDHGCSSLILWDLKTFTIKSKLQGHSAAVTCIVDLQDGAHLITGSYDKKLNLCNYRNPNILFSLPNRVSISGCVLSGDRVRLVSSGLDGSLTIWRINRKQGILESITCERIINTNTLICSLRSLYLYPECFLASGKDGKILMINMITEQIVETYNPTNNSIIEMVTFERKNHSKHPLILSCSAKDKQPILTKSNLNIHQAINLYGRIGIQYGCGIGPKITFSKNNQIAIVNQSKQYKQILLYKIKLH